MKKGSVIIAVVIATLVIVAAIVGVGLYIGKRVSSVQQPNNVVTNNAIASPVPSSTPDITANWKTYSIANQFEFKYPLDQYSVVSGQTNLDYAYPGQLIVKPNDSFVQSAGSNVYSLTITPIINKNHLTLTNVDTLLGVDNSKNTFPPVSITIGGIVGSRYNNVPGQVDRTEIYIIKPDKNNPGGIIYNLTLRTLNGAKASAENESTIQNIFSTFKFTN